jgi:uncharacterized ferredoxin-like protein
MKEAAEMVVNLMSVAARTAPKAGGKDFLEIIVIAKHHDLQKIAEVMKAYAPQSSNESFWLRDAANIENADALLLIGLRESKAAGYDCGACGHPTCSEYTKCRQLTDKAMGYSGPHCVMRMMDIGVALASAAKTASMLNLDNRVQQRVGAAARALGLINAEVAMGIPVSISGKNIFFDRKVPAK